MITGGMHDWAGSLGIASFTPELGTGEGSDTEANHAALHAIFDQATALLPLPEDHIEGAFSVPAPIWRYWRSIGGAERLGMPIEAPQREAGRLIQTFARARIAADPGRVDTTAFVTLEPLGEAVREQLAPPIRIRGSVKAAVYADMFHTAETQLGGAGVLGTPLGSPEAGISLSDGAPRVVQYFARARLELDPAASEPLVTLSPLGWYHQQLVAVTSAIFSHQIR